MTSNTSRVGRILREIRAVHASPKAGRQLLVSALRRIGGVSGSCAQPIDATLRDLSELADFTWVTSAAYWSLRESERSLPSGTVFTPPGLADQVVGQLLPGVTVVDLGAGTGMLTLAAALRGFDVVAIEEDSDMALVLDALARILGVRDCIQLHVGDALFYQGEPGHQIMANPPYTRHQSIPREKKEELADLARRLGTPLPMTAGYHAYFMVYAWAAKWSQREALLLPTNWLETRYGRPLRHAMLERGLVEIAVIQSADGKPAFWNSHATACLVTTGGGLSPAGDASSTPRVRLAITPEGRLSEPSVGTLLVDRIRRVVQPKAAPIPSSALVLGDVFHARRGIATGANSFFALDASVARELGLPADELRPVLRRLTPRIADRHIQYLWVPHEPPSAASLRRIRAGEALGLDGRYLCSQRRPWWRLAVSEPPDYFISYMGRSRPVIRANRRGLLNLNNIHGLYLRPTVARRTGRRVAAWLRSEAGHAALMSCSRRYGGLWKLEPGDIQRVALPSDVL